MGIEADEERSRSIFLNHKGHEVTQRTNLKFTFVILRALRGQTEEATGEFSQRLSVSAPPL